MRSSSPWLLWILAFVLLVAGPVLGWVQYGWLGELHEAETERLTSGLRAGVERFARDFDREIGDLFIVFQTSGEAIEGAYDSWAGQSRFRDLLREVWTATPVLGGSEAWSRFVPAGRFFEPSELPPEIASRLAASRTPGALVVEPLDEDRWLVMVPQPPVDMAFSKRASGSSGLLLFERFAAPNVLVLDRRFLAAEMIPELARRHFPSTGEGFDYAISRSWAGAETEELLVASDPAATLERLASPDAEITLLDASRLNGSPILSDRLSSVEQSFGPASSELLAGALSAGVSALACTDFNLGASWTSFDAHGLSTPASPDGGSEAFSMTFMLARGGQGGDEWKLRIRHRSGSLEAALAQARHGNLALAGLMLAVVTSSLALLVLLVLRGQRLARRQMDFVAGVSHEFRTPLAVIGSAAGNLADGLVEQPEQVRTYGDLLRSESRRLTDLVERVLAFASSGERRLELEPVEVGDVVRRVLDEMRRTLEDEGIDVERRIPRDLPAALADRAALATVLENLVSNAVKYGRPGRWIGIEARPETGLKGREIDITVRDRGPGIDPEDRPHLFVPFYRGRRAREAQIPGSGLGLCVVDRLVKKLGGRVSLAQETPRGTAWTLHLPVALEVE